MHAYVNPAIFHDYKKPIMIVEGKGQYLFDETGKAPERSLSRRAVLREIDQERLQANCLNIGASLKAGSEKLAEQHSIIGQIRGKGTTDVLRTTEETEGLALSFL